MTATSGRLVSRSLSWQPGRFSAAVLLVSALVALWLVSPVFWDRLGGDSRAFYSAARVDQRGGDPYSFSQLKAEEAAVDANSGRHPGTTAYGANPYHYPPLMTVAWEALTPLGDRGFYWANLGVLLLLGVAGFEMVLAALSWTRRGLPRALFLVSPATAVVLVSGNPSTVLLAAWGGALLAASRRRALLAGALLAIGWIKPPVGLPAAAALLLAGPGSKRSMLAGFGLGTLGFGVANIAVGGGDQTLRWARSLFEFTATLDPRQAEVIGQCCLTGLPGLMLGAVPMPVAVAAAGLLALAMLWVAARRGLLGDSSPDPLWTLAILVALALVVTPYVHLNDLVLESLPVLLIASQPLTAISRLTLLLWGLGVVTPVVLSLFPVVASAGLPSSVAPFGLLLALLTAVSLTAGRQPAGSPAAVPAAA
ncbi:MAG TPA: glycosyltransferase 87 family protein [Candidatus Solibacter sp.]|nr:glycosyltransferase 87 family protein [Candidatus Solibacter sp.]